MGPFVENVSDMVVLGFVLRLVVGLIGVFARSGRVQLRRIRVASSLDSCLLLATVEVLRARELDEILTKERINVWDRGRYGRRNTLRAEEP